MPGTGGYRNPPAVRESKPAHGSEKSAKSRRANGIAFPLPVLGIVAGLVVLGLVLWLLFRTRIVDASVTAVSWQHDVIVDRYEVHRKEGWSASPDAFDVQDEGRRLHHYDRVKVGSHKESYLESYTCGETCTTVPGSCYTTPRTCTSNQNGTATCTGGDRVCSPDTKSCTPKTCTRTAWRTVDDYENQPRYRTWYSWKVWEWGYNRTVRASGSTVETRWPSEEDLRPNRLAPGERERHRRQGSYSVTFSGDGDSWTIHPSTEDDFRRFSPGSRFKLRVGIARGVTVLGADGSSSEY